MLKWRVYVEQWNGKRIDEYFHNKTEAMKFFNKKHSTSLAIQLLKYNGQIWIIKKFWV